MMPPPFPVFFSLLALAIGSALHSHARNASASPGMGTSAVKIEAGSTESPFYKIVSVSLSSPAVFQGYVESIDGYKVVLNKSIDVSNPSLAVNPLRPGFMGNKRARAQTSITENGSISQVQLTYPGDRYGGPPLVFIEHPMDENGSFENHRVALAEADWNSTTGRINSIQVIEPGAGYSDPPAVSIDGGPYFMRILDEDSNYSGICLRISDNGPDYIELNASQFDEPDQFLLSGTRIEIVSAFTIGSLLGYEETSLNMDENSSLADWVYFLKDPDAQSIDGSNYFPIFHNGTGWRSVDSPEEDFSDRALFPGESFIIARRSESSLTLYTSGIVGPNRAFWELPERGKLSLCSNPYPHDVMLSDLLTPSLITEDNSSSGKNFWLAHSNPELADQVQILQSSLWSTYWHDGTNLDVSKHARIRARSGSGIGGSLTVSDFSLSRGQIENLYLGENGKVRVQSTSHGLKKGFLVTLAGVIGRKVNSKGNQVNFNNFEVPEGEGIIMQSMINGDWEIVNATENTFDLSLDFLDCDFIDDQNASWYTGSPGQGYETENLALSITGGGGTGARAIARVTGGKIANITVLSGGLLYSAAPEVVVHTGGWKNLTSGNVPINDVLIKRGSGIILVRNHPFGSSNHVQVGRDFTD